MDGTISYRTTNSTYSMQDGKDKVLVDYGERDILWVEQRT